MAILQPYEGQPRESERTAPKPLLIEIPSVGSLPEVEVLPPTVFVLKDGQRLEARRFVLLASNLSLTIDRHQRTVPIETLDTSETTIANHDRGIDLRIPADPNETSVSF